ncbi:LysE family translocator [Pasteurella testudinis]|uniref:LysE family translocator n=1 Tax=Pasteurella testudinis TaxID=761 RepID=UPI0040583C08
MIEQLMVGFWVLSLSLVLTPGMDWAYVMAAAAGGRVWAALFGMLLGYLLVIFLVMAGVGAVVVANPVLLHGLTLVGAAYLAWLGVQTLRAPSRAVQTTAEPQAARRWITNGIRASGLNPKVLLGFIALTPPFLSTQAGWPIPAQILTLGLVHLANCAVIYPLVGFGVGAVMKKRPHYAANISRLSGMAMMAISAWLLVGMLQTA